MPSLHLSGCAGEEHPGSSLAAELMSTSADDWAAGLCASDAGSLSSLCLAVLLRRRLRHLVLGEARQNEARRADLSVLRICSPFTCRSLYFSHSIARMVARSNTVSNTAKSRREG